MTKSKSTGMSDKASDIILVTICTVVLLIVAYPLYYVLIASFSDPYDVYAGKTFLLPSGFTFDGYKAVFADPKIVSGFLNSVKYTVIGTIFSVVMLYITAYPLAQKDLPGRKWISLFFVFTMYFGGGLVPTYLVVRDTGLMGSMWALFLPGGVGVGNMIIVRTSRTASPTIWWRPARSTAAPSSVPSSAWSFPCPCPFWRSRRCLPWWPTGTTGSPP